MTPQATRILAQLRQDFYTSFAQQLEIPTNIIKGNAHSSSPSRTSWIDGHDRLNYLYIYAHTAPDTLTSERPLVLRLGVNKGLGIDFSSRRRDASSSLFRVLRFDLTLLPEEILDFVPWVVSLLTDEDQSRFFLTKPPYPLDCHTLDEFRQHGAWTRNASLSLAKSPTVQCVTFSSLSCSG